MFLQDQRWELFQLGKGLYTGKIDKLGSVKAIIR